MIAKAKSKYIRISPRKVTGVIKLIKGKPVSKSLNTLSGLNKKAGVILNKIIRSAVSNASSRGIDVSDLRSIYISRLVVNPGPVLKRFRAAPFGRATAIRKRTSHIEIELDRKD